MSHSDFWPPLPLNEWQDTYRTLHLWTQIVGKIRMTLSPPINHWWHVTLYVNSHGLTTGPVPYSPGVFEIQFDFEKHVMNIFTSEGPGVSRPLRAECVASFYDGIYESLASLGIAVEINPKPQEVADPVPFDRDYVHCSYDAQCAQRFWRILVSSVKVFDRFRGKFVGNLACARFSGRPAPPRKGVISGPAYSHELCSAGFWPGGGVVDEPAYYSYTVPKPAGLEREPVRPAAAGWNAQLSEFILRYDDVRRADSPDQALYDFLESTYEAGARLGKWDRAVLEA